MYDTCPKVPGLARKERSLGRRRSQESERDAGARARVGAHRVALLSFTLRASQRIVSELLGVRARLGRPPRIAESLSS